MKFDRKLLLIAPTIVLAFIVAGIVYASVQVRSLTTGEDTWDKRREFITAVETGQKSLTSQQAVGLLKISLEVESRRAAALDSAYELLLVLAGMAGACCVVLVLGIRKIPRQHWPRLKFGVAPGTPRSSPALES